MTVGRIWAWNLDEMRSVGTMMDAQQERRTDEYASDAASVVCTYRY